MQHGTVPDKMGIGKEEGCCFLWENVLRSTARPVLGLSGLLQRCCLVMKDQTGTRHLWDRSEGFQATSSRSSDPAAHPALQQDSGETVGDLQLCNLLSPVRLCWRTVVTAVPPLRQQLRSILRWQCLEQTAPSFISFIATVPLLLRDSLQCPPLPMPPVLPGPALLYPVTIRTQPGCARPSGTCGKRQRRAMAAPAPATNPRGSQSRGGPCGGSRSPCQVPGAAAGGTGGTSHSHRAPDLPEGLRPPPIRREPRPRAESRTRCRGPGADPYPDPHPGPAHLSPPP